MQKRRRPEQEIQRAVCRHLQARAWPDVVWWHTPNGGRRNKIEAAILKGLGVMPGVPDLVLAYRGHSFALELKAPGGRATASQLEFTNRLEKAGWFCAICEGSDRAVKCLEAWGLLRSVA